MAYQRPFLISLKRDSQEPWGFRTFGGKEYGEPHIVEKVIEDSIAEQCGIREGDEIIQIGRMNIQDFTFGQVQEQLARSGNKIEMFVVREDLLSPRKGKEPSHVKAIVHNPYNSPLNLYSTENIAETLAKQTEVLTEGHVSSTEEEDAPENLSFKQKSAVFQLLEEQAKQESLNPKDSRPRKAPPPPPKAPPSAAQYYQNKENYSPHEHTYDSMQYQQHQTAYNEKDGDLYLNKSPAEYKREEQKVSSYTVQSQKSVSFATTNHYSGDHNPSSEYISTYKATPSTDRQAAVFDTRQHQQQSRSIHQQQQPQSREVTFQQHTERQQFQQANQQQYQPHQQQRQISQQQQNWDSQSQRQQQIQSQKQIQQPQQQIQSQKQIHQSQQQQIQSRKHTSQPQQQQIQSQKQAQQSQNQQSQHQLLQQQQRLQSQQPNQQRFQPDHSHKDKQMQRQQYQQMQQPQPETYDDLGSPATPVGYKSPPTHKIRPNWPPQNMSQQNGRWHSPSPTPSSPTKNLVAAAWPPKQPTVKDLPKTGFNPAAIKEQGSGRRCVWPPPKSDDEFRSGRTTPQSPVTGRRIAWNPSPSPPLTRRSPFASPVARRKDIAWPPPQPVAHRVENHRPSPTLSRKSRLDDYVKQHATTNVPSTYRPPPGTQRVEYA